MTKGFIKREDAREKLCSMCRWEGTAMCSECEHPIDDIPASDVRPVVRGRWNKVRDPHLYRMEPFVGICSVCQFAAGYNEATRFFKHCPNCGAQMDADMREVGDG